MHGRLSLPEERPLSPEGIFGDQSDALGVESELLGEACRVQAADRDHLVGQLGIAHPGELHHVDHLMGASAVMKIG